MVFFVESWPLDSYGKEEAPHVVKNALQFTLCNAASEKVELLGPFIDDELCLENARVMFFKDIFQV